MIELNCKVVKKVAPPPFFVFISPFKKFRTPQVTQVEGGGGVPAMVNEFLKLLKKPVKKKLRITTVTVKMKKCSEMKKRYFFMFLE